MSEIQTITVKVRGIEMSTKGDWVEPDVALLISGELPEGFVPLVAKEKEDTDAE